MKGWMKVLFNDNDTYLHTDLSFEIEKIYKNSNKKQLRYFHEISLTTYYHSTITVIEMKPRG